MWRIHYSYRLFVMCGWLWFGRHKTKDEVDQWLAWVWATDPSYEG